MKVRSSRGTPGKSAYQIWLDQGNTGTEADFLASLKPPPGSGGVQDVVADYTASTDAANGVLTIDASQEKTKIRVTVDADVTIAFSNTSGLSKPLTLLLVASGSNHEVAFSGVAAVGGQLVGSVTIPDGSWVYVAVEFDPLQTAPAVASISPVFGVYVPPPASWNVSAGTQKVTVSYTNAQGVAHTDYRYSTDNGSSWTAWAEVPGPSPFDITGLTAGVEVIVQGSHRDANGNRSATVEGRATPLASTEALLVVANTSSLDTADTFLRARLEAVGYTVTYRDAATFSAADANGKALIAISPSVGSVTNANTYLTLGVPVVCYAGYSADDLGLFPTGTATSTTKVIALDPAHPVWQGVTLDAQNAATVYASTTYIVRNIDPLQTGVVPLAEHGATPGTYAMAYAPTGTTLNGVVTTNPISWYGGRNSTNIDSLNANGQKILENLAAWTGAQA